MVFMFEFKFLHFLLMFLEASAKRAFSLTNVRFGTISTRNFVDGLAFLMGSHLYNQLEKQELNLTDFRLIVVDCFTLY